MESHGDKTNQNSIRVMPISFSVLLFHTQEVVPDSKVHGANMGPTWVLSAPDGPHVGPMNFAIWDSLTVVTLCVIVLKRRIRSKKEPIGLLTACDPFY